MIGLNRQRGELSLLSCALLFAGIALVAAVALFSMSSERNFFAEAWSGAMRTQAGQSAQQLWSATTNVTKFGTMQAAEIRKCTIDGMPVYANVECSAKSPHSRKVDLHDSGGIEAPKAPPAVESEGAPRGIQDKMIDKATR
jgi:hypothetical protein